MKNVPVNRLGENLWKMWFKDSVIVGCDPYFIKKDEFIAEINQHMEWQREATKSQTDNTELRELARLFANRIGSPYGEGATYDHSQAVLEPGDEVKPNGRIYSHLDDEDFELFVKDFVEAIQAKLSEQDIKSRIDESELNLKNFSEMMSTNYGAWVRERIAKLRSKA